MPAKKKIAKTPVVSEKKKEAVREIKFLAKSGTIVYVSTFKRTASDTAYNRYYMWNGRQLQGINQEFVDIFSAASLDGKTSTVKVPASVSRLGKEGVALLSQEVFDDKNKLSWMSI